MRTPDSVTRSNPSNRSTRSTFGASAPFVGAALCAAWALAASPASAATRTYAATGSLQVETTTLDPTTKLVAPKSGGPYPLIVASHGFSASGQNQLGWALHFASYGFVVAVPTFGGFPPDNAANASAIASLVTRLTGAEASANKVKPGAFGLEGHSAGGLATTLAAAKLSPTAVVLFDPVDAGGKGKAAYGKLCSPVMGIFAEAGACNQQADWTSWATTMPGERTLFKVNGSTHCDGENEPRALCGSFCGGAASVTRQSAYAHYATAFFLAKLSNDSTAAATLTDAGLKGDSDLSSASVTAGTCSPAGSSSSGGSSSGGSSSSSTSSSSSSSSSGADVTEPTGDEPSEGSPSSNGASSSAESGGGCGAAGASRPAGAGVLALAALGLVLGRRRHARG